MLKVLHANKGPLLCNYSGEESPFYNSVQILTDLFLSHHNPFRFTIMFSDINERKKSTLCALMLFRCVLVFCVLNHLSGITHTQSHGHSRPRCQDYLFMRLNQAYDGLRIPSAGAPVSFPEREGHESCIAPPCHTRDTRRVARATRWEVRGPA